MLSAATVQALTKANQTSFLLCFQAGVGYVAPANTGSHAVSCVAQHSACAEMTSFLGFDRDGQTILAVIVFLLPALHKGLGESTPTSHIHDCFVMALVKVGLLAFCPIPSVVFM